MLNRANERAPFAIALQLWTWAAALRILKHIVPLTTLVRMVRTRPRSGGAREETIAALKAYLESAERFPFRAPGNCLERSLGAYRILCEANARPELVVGVRKSERGVEGHVWLSVGGAAWGERAADVTSFTRIVSFDAQGRQRTAAGFDGALETLRVR